jgi:hypothetical protein
VLTLALAEIECCMCRGCQLAADMAARRTPVRAQDLVLPPIRAAAAPPSPRSRKPAAARSVRRGTCRPAVPMFPLSLTWRSPAAADPTRAATQKPCFDVFRSDARSESLIHIASSTTRWSGIPLLPLPHARARAGHRPTFGPLEDLAAVAAQQAFEAEVVRSGRACRHGSPGGPAGSSATSAEEDDDDGERTQTHRHVCPRCDKRFNRPSSLVAHGRTHTGYKRTHARAASAPGADAPPAFACPFPACGRGFSVHSNMRRHYSTHLAKTADGESPPDSPF